MCVGITIVKWDNTCRSQHHGTEPPVHFCCSHYISPCFLSTSLSFSLSLSLSLSLSPPSFSLWLQDTCHLMPFTKYPLLNQSYFFTPYPSIAHIKFTNYSPTIFYDYHPQSCLKNMEKHLFRSQANRRLVVCLPEGKYSLIRRVPHPTARFFAPLSRPRLAAAPTGERRERHIDTPGWAQKLS